MGVDSMNHLSRSTLIQLNLQFSSQSLLFSRVTIILYPPLTRSTALVDDRLGGDGTGKPLGISDPILGWVIISVLSAVWSLFFLSTRFFNSTGDEDGLGL